MNSKSDTVDAELNGILKDYRQVLTQQMGLILSGRHRLDIKIADNVLLDEAKAKLKSLLLRERIDERLHNQLHWAKRLQTERGRSPQYFADEMMKENVRLEAELSRLSGEESHE